MGTHDVVPRQVANRIAIAVGYLLLRPVTDVSRKRIRAAGKTRRIP